MIDIKPGITIISGFDGTGKACYDCLRAVERDHPSGAWYYPETREYGPSKEWNAFLKGDTGREASDLLSALPNGKLHEGFGLSLANPETDMHPMLQVEFAEHIARLASIGAGDGLWILVSTFSPTLVKGLIACAERCDVPISCWLVEDEGLIDSHPEKVSPEQLYKDLNEPLKSLEAGEWRFEQTELDCREASA